MKKYYKRFINMLFVFAIMFVGSKWIMNNYDIINISPAAKEQLNQIQALPLIEFKKNIEQGKWNIEQEKTLPTFVFLYASWCPFCQKQYPILVELQKKYEGKMEFIFLSSDRKIEKLAELLSTKSQPLPFIPYNIIADEAPSYKAFITSKGGHFAGGIPYMAIFNSKGELKQETVGFYAQKGLQERIEFIINSVE